MILVPVLGRYVIGAVLRYTLLVMLVLLILIGLYTFITQQDEIGTGSYQLADAFLFVALNLPQNAFELLPIGALIGALLGLGALARGSELIVMRAAGVSVARIAAWTALAGIVLGAVTWAIGEYMGPQLEQYAQQQKTLKRFQQFSRAGSRGAWAKDGTTFISVQQQSARNEFSGIYVFRFAADGTLESLARAATASVGPANEWVLEDYAESRFASTRVEVRRAAREVLSTRLAPEFLGLATVRPNQLAGSELRAYIEHLRQNGLESSAYETAFWVRIARSASLVAAVMLAVPFSFGSLRASGAGARMVMGILLGAAFLLLAQMLENGGQVFGLDPVVIAWAPTAVMAFVALIAVARTR